VNGVAQAFAVLAGLIHIWAWLFESFFFSRPQVHQGVFHTPSNDVPAVRLWSFNQGFYNLFLAVGAITGVLALNTGRDTAGRALVIYVCTFMVGAAVVLGAGAVRGAWDRRHLRGAFGQGIPPLAALIAALV
jgi:putative membrane protein